MVIRHLDIQDKYGIIYVPTWHVVGVGGVVTIFSSLLFFLYK